MLQVASPSFAQYTNWPTMLEPTRRRNWWAAQHAVGSLQLKQSSLTTVGARFPWSVSCKPTVTLHIWSQNIRFNFSVLQQICVHTLTSKLHDIFFSVYTKLWGIQYVMVWTVLQCTDISARIVPSTTHQRDCCVTTCVTTWTTTSAPSVTWPAPLHHPLVCIFATDTWTASHSSVTFVNTRK